MRKGGIGLTNKQRLYYLKEPTYEVLTEFAPLVDMPMHIKVTHDWTVHSASRSDDDGCIIVSLQEARSIWNAYVKRGFVRLYGI